MIQYDAQFMIQQPNQHFMTLHQSYKLDKIMKYCVISAT